MKKITDRLVWLLLALLLLAVLAMMIDVRQMELF
jgi:hypothetical protein